MADTDVHRSPAEVSARLHRAALRVAGRLAVLLAGTAGPGHEALPFLRTLADQPPDAGGPAPAGGCVGGTPFGAPDPVDRLAAVYRLTTLELDLLVLAGSAEEHEGLAAVLRGLHPAGEPAVTTGLVAAMVEVGALDRPDERPVRVGLRALLADGPLLRAGLLVDGPGSAWERSLRPAPGLWAALHGGTAAPPDAVHVGGGVRLARPVDPSWQAALRALLDGVPCTVVLQDRDPAGAAVRAAGVLAGAGLPVLALAQTAWDATGLQSAVAVAVCRGRIPVLAADRLTGGTAALDGLPVPVVLAVPDGVAVDPTARAALTVPLPGTGAADRQAMWATLLPAGTAPAPLAPAAVAPHQAAAAATDATTRARLLDRPVAPDDVRRAVALRAPDPPPAGTVRVTPTAGWDDLVLPAERVQQLREVVDRVTHEERVLDGWGFLAGRPGRRGVRLLFSGPPGTGKTLAAEVLAGAIGRDLLVVDLSQLVSKWLGETEKNLAAAFEAGERRDAVLFFDEADALFGRRTEVGDARDRYANLETAYLLSRLATSDGVTVLATNLRANLDAAFVRRLEFVVPFEPPDEDERRVLWARHLPARAPVAADVDLDLLAALYPVSGALIRNAAVAAAFRAAADGGVIRRAHLALAVRREYAKAGRAFPCDPVLDDDPPADVPPRHEEAPCLPRLR
jgi:hypothetical protein